MKVSLNTIKQYIDFELPPEGSYATGIAFLPQGSGDAKTAVDGVEKIVEAEGLTVLGWRDVPTDHSCLGHSVRAAVCPGFGQIQFSVCVGIPGYIRRGAVRVIHGNTAQGHIARIGHQEGIRYHLSCGRDLGRG